MRISHIKYFAFILFLFFLKELFSQETNLSSEFSWPTIPNPELAGNFAEPRGKHFHAGIDIKTYTEMKQVKSIADGYVSRVSISPWGYGHCIYIDHYNGYTSVYAHLNKFTPILQEFIRDAQYQNKCFSIDTCISPELFRVKKGEVIAYSGNTGHSAGPHLHFEIRKTQEQVAINTMQNIYKFPDNIAPALSHIVLYPLDFVSKIDGKNKKKIYKLTKENNKYKILGEKPKISGKIGIGIAYIDKINNSNNTFAAQQTALYLDNIKIYNSYIEDISFSKQENKNSMFDYQILRDQKLHSQKLFIEENNEFDYYDKTIDRGQISVDEDKDYNIKIEIIDFNNNKSTANIILKGEKISNELANENINIVSCNKSYLFLDRNLRVEIEAGSIFHDIDFQIKKVKDTKFSQLYIIGDSDFYVKKDFRITFYLDPKFDALKNKIFIAGKEKNKFTYIKSERQQNFISAKAKHFGEFYLEIDSIPPKITGVNIRQGISLKGSKHIEVKIEDDFSGIKSYDMYINDKWVLGQYDPKKKSLKYIFDDRMPKSDKYELKVIVSDMLDNRSEYKAIFTY